MDSFDIVAFKFNKEKLCGVCYYELVGTDAVRFGVVYRAVQVLSTLKNCDRCGKNLLDLFDSRAKVK